MPNILLVEDSEDIVALIEANIGDLGFPVNLDIATDGKSGLEKALVGDFELAILDVDLPHIDGFTICKRLRSEGLLMPILMLTGRDQVEQRVAGLEAGADDYLTKPFSTHELLARIRAVLRRSNFDPLEESGSKPTVTDENVITVAQLRIDLQTREVFRDGQKINLSKSEFDALSLLAKQPGRVFSRSELLRLVLGYENPKYESNINTLITRLRSKIEPDTSNPTYIHTEWGVGYRFSVSKEKE